MTNALTPRQKQILKLVRRAVDKEGVFPTIRDIAKEMGFASPKAAADHLSALAKKGHLTRDVAQRSGYKIANATSVRAENFEDTSFPLASGLAAGAPKEAFDEAANERLRLTPDFFGGGEQVAVTISGDSMSGDGINDGDIAIIKLQKTFAKNDIVAVRVGELETTLKRLRIRDRQAELIPSNPQHVVRVVALENLEVIGKLSGIVRRT